MVMRSVVAINKPVYDALVDAGASEEKATLAACAVLPSVDEAATKTDITLLSSAIERLEEVMTAAIERSEANTKKDIAELKVGLLKWIAAMLGVAVAAIGLIVNLSLGGLSLGGLPLGGE